MEVTGDFEPMHRTEHQSFYGVSLYPPVGTYVSKEGAVKDAYCQIDSTNAIATIFNKRTGAYYTLTNMWSAEILSGSSVHGDSGAPIYSGGLFCGISDGREERRVRGKWEDVICIFPFFGLQC